MNETERYHLITRNTQEITTETELKELLKKKANPSVYLGTAITGRPHIGYFVWVLKMADWIKAGFKVKVLLADIHGMLDNTPAELVEARFNYYNLVIPAMFEAVGADLKSLEIVKGSSFQLSEKYMYDVLNMATHTSVHDCIKASSEVVKQSDNPKLSGLIYPIMQALDEEYLKVDIQYGGVDQRKILMFARENLPKLGYKSRVEIMTPLIPGLTEGGKMSASNKNSKIDLADSEGDVMKKINAAYCLEGVVENNGVLAFLKYVIMVRKQDNNEELVIERPEKFGGTVRYKTYEAVESDFVKKKLHPMDLKKALAIEINKLISPIRLTVEHNKEILRRAYAEE